jgi:ribonucleoside-diphosphate reductase alpha chain
LLSENAKKIFKTLYSINGETIEETFRRVSSVFSNNELEQNRLYDLLIGNVWRPNTPVFMNAGVSEHIFSACWVVTLEDSMTSIYDIVSVARKIFQAGAGIGIPIGNLREENAPIFERDKSNTPDIPKGFSSGAVKFLDLYDVVGDTTKSGGRARRAAILASMQVDHPDIIKFIKCKTNKQRLSNMNISVKITDEFMENLENNVPFNLKTPFDGTKKDTIMPDDLWRDLARSAWISGDPGLIFIDTVNKMNPAKSLEKIETSNPCGEQHLTPWLACNLSSLNISKFVKNGEFDFDGLFDTAAFVARMMDNLIDSMLFPDERFKIKTLEYRPIGVGIMGFADTLYMLGLKYNSLQTRNFASEVMRTLTHGCIFSSIISASEKGTFPLYDKVKDDLNDIILQLISKQIPDKKVEMTKELLLKHGVRNVSHTCIAPTGTIAISCDCSYGMEPSFGIVWEKTLIEDGSVLRFINPIFEEKYKDASWYKDDILEKILQNGGSIKNIRAIPKEIREVFVIAHDIKPKDKVDMVAALQKHTSNGVSVTINLPNDISAEEISDIYKYAYYKNLKGVTVYRDGCKKDQPVSMQTKNNTLLLEKRPMTLTGCTKKVPVGDNNVLFTLNTFDGNLAEVILQVGKNGARDAANVEAIGRSVSIGLRNGIPAKEYVKQFKDISSEDFTWVKFEDDDKKAVQIKSIPDALAKIMERYYVEDVMIPDGDICPKCNSNTIIKVEGCETCQSCGFSKCS